MVENLISKITSRPRNTKLDPKKFVRLINKQYLSTRADNAYRIKKSFSPSTIGYGHGKCPRYWSFAFTGANFSESQTAPQIASMNSGTTAHERIQDTIEKTGLLIEKEKEVLYSDPPIRGFADVIVDADGTPVVGEIKTTKHSLYMQKKDEGVPADSHLLQILVYMKVLGMDEGFILYESKDTNELVSLPVVMSKKNEEYINYVFDWMKEVYDAWVQKKNIKRGFAKSTYTCKNCPVFDQCYEASNGRTNIPVLEVKIP